MNKYVVMIVIWIVCFMAAGCQALFHSDEQLKAEIMAEVLIEVRKQLAIDRVSGESVAEARAQIKWEIEQDVLKKVQMLAPGSEAAMTAGRLLEAQEPGAPTGDAEGYILRNGKGLPNCRVKLVELVPAETFFGVVKAVKERNQFEAVTDEDGKYRFEGLPLGNYKIKWQLPDNTGWVRRLRRKTDVTIEAGKTSTLSSIDAGKRLVPS